ncbi:hypothetical protein U879_06765 [Defluviimonas sp. 20V17]|uniref:Methyltransferase FkbM domain-containing protein n=1 Tax=Allgaiera indica TaxID=765699 RepID=A0AAN5A0X4_9RHOB|nr:FkbM family methyltransferase [Allgaiera indica]KDB04452.1 hypothetical protein U879_06765 [Defluviimonas sp. 20V17]GHE05144.1 hypothetical protein GCM10008024_34910 [Allgaiera indica]SDX65901.1 Methyltransferase FkbM domain-containing protein [Allgaiera indica]
MRAVLARLNKKRLYRRHARKANAEAWQKYAALSAQERALIAATLSHFRPVETGHPLVRCGPNQDGGYLLPDDLAGLTALYSPGVSDTTGFDLEMAESGLACFLADGSVDRPSHLHPNMRFEKMMIGPAMADGYMTLDSWVSRTAPSSGDLLMQMDIEGSEYDVLLCASEKLLSRFRIIVLEMHFIDRMLFGPDRDRLDRLFRHLARTHVLCHTHVNNVAAPVRIGKALVPPFVELTFLRLDRVSLDACREAEYPHPLDVDNMPDLPPASAIPFWRSEVDDDRCKHS